MQYKKNEAPVISISREQAFDNLFRQYYQALCFYAQSIIHIEEEAKDIVQESYKPNSAKCYTEDLAKFATSPHLS